MNTWIMEEVQVSWKALLNGTLLYWQLRSARLCASLCTDRGLGGGGRRGSAPGQRTILDVSSERDFNRILCLSRPGRWTLECLLLDARPLWICTWLHVLVSVEFSSLNVVCPSGINCRPDFLTNLDKSRSRRPDSVQPSWRSCRIPGRYRLRCCPREHAGWSVLPLDQR